MINSPSGRGLLFPKVYTILLFFFFFSFFKFCESESCYIYNFNLKTKKNKMLRLFGCYVEIRMCRYIRCKK